jgi:1-pyrroline-5-carboxylate dehydrogenase
MKEKKPTPQPLCPFCSCSFKEKELIVEMKMVYKFDNDGRVFIRQKAFDKITGFIERAKNDPEARIVAGGHFEKTEGYFIQPFCKHGWV